GSSLLLSRWDRGDARKLVWGSCKFCRGNARSGGRTEDEIEVSIRVFDRGPPPPARVTRRQRVGADLIDVEPARLAVANGSLARLDGIDVGDRLPTRSLRQTAYSPRRRARTPRPG